MSMEKAPADYATCGALLTQHGPQMYSMLSFVVGSFGLDPILLTKCNILDPCYEI